MASTSPEPTPTTTAAPPRTMPSLAVMASMVWARDFSVSSCTSMSRVRATVPPG